MSDHPDPVGPGNGRLASEPDPNDALPPSFIAKRRRLNLGHFGAALAILPFVGLTIGAALSLP